MDGILASTKAGRPEAAAALDVFRLYANQNDLGDSAAASKWWNAHRDDWATARFPRGVPPNGGPIHAFILTTGRVGGIPPWRASILLENSGKEDIYVNLAEVASLQWNLLDRDGQRVVVPDKREETAPNWIALKPGKIVTQAAPIELEASRLPQRGPYTLHAWLNVGSDLREVPPGTPVFGIELPLPAITVAE